MRLLDLFAGRWGWSKAFAARGWDCVGVDLVEPPEIPKGCTFQRRDILEMTAADIQGFDFIVASSPCEQFSVHGMKHFHPNPKYPELGIKLFNHTRALCEASGVPYVMENVRAAQPFVGKATHHCGPFYLWGSGVPPLMPQGIIKGMKLGGAIKFGSMPIEERRKHRTKDLMLMAASGSPERLAWTSKVATIPPELANCVAEYAERIAEGAMKEPKFKCPGFAAGGQ
jgi:C-5 cytosine-specific DNA methylase